MHRVPFLILLFGSAVYCQVDVKSSSSQGAVSIQLKIDTTNWQWEINIANKIPNSYIKLYEPGLDYFRSPFKLYDSTLGEITSRCIIVDRYIQGNLYSKSQAKKITVDSTSSMTKIVDIKRISSGNHYSLDKYFCRIKPNNLIGFVYSTPVIVYNKQDGNEIGRFNLMFSTAKMNVSKSKMLTDSASFPFLPN